jgi:hypothetical protein
MAIKVSRIPTVVIYSPTADAVVGYSPFLVTGLVTAAGYPEPVEIDSVTVQVDSGPVIAATLKRIPNKTLTEVTFRASVQVTGGQDPHTVTVTTASDGESETKTVLVTAGIRVVPPAVVVDIGTLAPVDPNDPGIQAAISSIQKRLASTSLPASLGAINKILIGPNLLAVTTPRATLRFGLWIEDYNFPSSELIPPSLPDFPLPTLTSDAATAGFALVPLLDLPGPVAYAFSLPTTTLQQILDSVKPELVAAASQHDYDLQSATVQTDPSGTVTVSFNGTLPLGIPLSASVTETLGTKTISESDGPQQVPAVLNTSTSVGVGSALDWIIGFFFPAVDLAFLGVFEFASTAASNAGATAGGIVAAMLAQIPPRIPITNTDLPNILNLRSNPFPSVIFNWTSFGASASGLVGSGTLALGERTGSTVQVAVSGPDQILNYEPGDDEPYEVTLTNIHPDQTGLIWQIPGTSSTGAIQADSFTQKGSFSVEFPVPSKGTPGKYPFTLTVSAVETSGTVSAGTLTGSASLSVMVEVPKVAP